MFSVNKLPKRTLLSVLIAGLGMSGVSSLQAEENERASAMEEVIVSARKMDESLQDVPLAISVLGGAMLENLRLDDVNDVLIRVPGVGFGQPFKSYTPIAIRGASTQDDNIGVDPNVAVFVDGVYIGGTTAVEFDLFDLERVEVLKGPQGTLFGRNTNGGVIHYVTKDPTDEFRAATTLTLGNHGRVEAAGSISGALTDTTLASFSAKTRNTSGYQENLVTGNTLGQEKISSARGKLRFTGTEDLDVVLAADYSVDDSFGIPRDFVGGIPDLTEGPKTTSLNKSMQDLDGLYERVSWGTSLKIAYETDIGTFHSLTAYRKHDNEMHDFDFDAVNGRTSDGRDTTEGFPFQATLLDSFSQEFRLDWEVNDTVNGTTGVYYLDENQYREEHLAASGVPGSVYYDGDKPRDILTQDVDTTSIALFTDVRINFTDAFTLSLGARLSKDEKDGTTECRQVGRFFCADVYSTDYDASWTEPSYRVVADYQVSEDIMGYVSYAKGYKSGGFSNAAAGDGPLEVVAPLLATPYNPEFSDSYELGFRMQFLDNSLTFNPTLFHVEYTDIQFLYLAGDNFISGNIGGGENTGIEFDLNYDITDNFNLWVGYAYSDSEYTEGSLYGADIIGNQLQLTPEHSLNMGFSYEHELENGKALVFSGDMVQKSRQYDDAMNAEDASTEFKDLFNLRMAYQPSDKVEVSLWVNNLLDKRNAVGTNSDPFFDGLVLSQDEIDAGERGLWVSHTPPRTFGATLTWEY